MKIMKNSVIYNQTLALNKAFEDTTQYLPIKVNFYLQKNKSLLEQLTQDIEKARRDILEQYSILNEEKGQFEPIPEKIEILTQELNDLFNLEQEVNIYTVKIDDFGEDLSLTTGQMQALMFMID